MYKERFLGLKIFLWIWLSIGDVRDVQTLPPPKPESTLREGYGLLYKYLGLVLHGVNRFWILLGYELPQIYYRTEINLLPEDFCAELGTPENTVTLLSFVCNSIWPMALRNQERIRVLQYQLDHIAHHDIPSILPGFAAEDIEYTPYEYEDPEKVVETEGIFRPQIEKKQNETLVQLMEEEHIQRYEAEPELDQLLRRVLNDYKGVIDFTGRGKESRLEVERKTIKIKRTVTPRLMPKPTERVLVDKRLLPTPTERVLLDTNNSTRYAMTYENPDVLEIKQIQRHEAQSIEFGKRKKRNIEVVTEEKVLNKEKQKYSKDNLNQTEFTLEEIDQFLDYLTEKELEIDREARQNTNTTQIPNRKKRFLGALIGIAGIGMDATRMGMDIHAKKKLDKSLKQLKQRMNRMNGKIVHLRKEMVSIAQAAFTDIDRIMKMLKFVHKELNYMFWQIRRLKHWLMLQEEKIADIASAVALLTEVWTRVLDWQNREITLLLHLIAEMNHLLDALDNLSNGHLSHTAVSPYTMKNMIQHAKETLMVHYPEFELIMEDTHQYYNVPIGSFQYTEGILAIQVPLFVKPRLQVPLLLYQLQTVPVPYHMNEEMIDMDESKYTYTWLKPSTPMLAMSKDTYIGIREEHLKRCTYIGKTWICQDVFLMKHRNYHTCESAIYFREANDIIKKKCDIDYYPHLEPEPSLLDQGERILLTGLKERWTYYCHAGDQLPTPIGTGHYVVVNKTDLCRCSISAGEYHIQQNIAYCTEDSDNILEFRYTVNMAVIIYLYEEQAETKGLTDVSLYNSPYEYDPKEPDIWTEEDPDVYKEDPEEQCFALDAVMTNLKEGRPAYASKGDKYVGNNEVDEWWAKPTDGNTMKRFFFIAGLVTLGLVIVVIVLVCIYLAMKGKVKIMDGAVSRVLQRVSIPLVQLAKPGPANAQFCDNIKVMTDRATRVYFKPNNSLCMIKCVNAGYAWLEMIRMVTAVLLVVLSMYFLYRLLTHILRLIMTTDLKGKNSKLFDFADKDRMEIHLLLNKQFMDGTSQKMSFLLGTFEGTLEDLNLEGEFKVGDVTYTHKIPWGYINIGWSSLTLKHKAVPLDLPTFVQVPFCKTWKMHKFTKSLKNQEDLVMVHLYGKNLWNQIWKKLTKNVSMLELGTLKLPDVLENENAEPNVHVHEKKEPVETKSMLYPNLHEMHEQHATAPEMD